MLRPFELLYLSLSPGLCSLHQIARNRLRLLAQSYPAPEILDVGGRKSPYTIGIQGRVTITELPRVSAVQHALNLGITDTISQQTRRRRSNVVDILYDDMTQSTLPDGAFDIVVAVEVLEHVEKDQAFVANVRRVLRPGGAFLMTTPNGDCVPNHNPDHKRHYRREELLELLSRTFSTVDIEYAVLGGPIYRGSLPGLTMRKPLRAVRSLTYGYINTRRSLHPEVSNQSIGTQHLIAVAYKEK